MTAVLGYLTQCAVCPQQAVLNRQVDEWVCPRCTEVTEPTIPTVQQQQIADAIDSADHYPLTKVQG